MAARKLYEGMVHFRTIEGRVVVFPGPDPARTGGTRWAKVKPSATSPSGVAVVGKAKPVPSGASKTVPKPTAKVASLKSLQVKLGQWRSKGNVPAVASSRAAGASGTKAGTKASPKPKPATTAPKAVKPTPAPKPKPEPRLALAPKVKAEPKSAPQPVATKGAIDPSWKNPGNYAIGSMKDRVAAYQKDRGNAKIDAIMETSKKLLAETQVEANKMWQRQNAIKNEVMQKGKSISKQEYDLKAKEFDEIDVKLANIQQTLNNKIRSRIVEVLAVNNPTKISTYTESQGIKNQVNDARNFIGSIFQDNGKGSNLVKFGVLGKEEGHRSHYNAKTNTINVSPLTNTSTYVHELGHFIESKMVDRNGTPILKQSLEFLNHRVGNEKPASMNDLTGKSHFSENELGRKDKFEAVYGDRAAYAGKDYGNHGTEILSMALEQLYKNPATLFKDRELTSYVFGILDGSLR